MVFMVCYVKFSKFNKTSDIPSAQTNLMMLHLKKIASAIFAEQGNVGMNIHTHIHIQHDEKHYALLLDSIAFEYKEMK